MYKFFRLIFLFPFITLHAQIHEVGIFVGGSNYVGDVGSTTYIAPNQPAIGVLYKWNKSPRHSYRISYIQSTLAGSDANSKEPSRYLRGYSFKNNIKELSLGLEFDFFDFNLHSFGQKITPYVSSGISYFMYDELYVSSGKTLKEKNNSALGIPIILGVKSNINRDFVLALEVGARTTTTDNLDGSNPKNENFKNNSFGNLYNSDWFVFSGLTLTYTFGNKPCYCLQ